MIRSRHLRSYTWFLGFYSKILINLHFEKVRMVSSIRETDRAVLMIGNHWSWWDGFIAYYIDKKIFRRRFHIMMLEEQLRSRMFLNKAGAFSIKKGSRSVMESIEYARTLLRDKNNMVVVYPQGTITSMHPRPVRFEKGIERLVRDQEIDFQIVFYVALTDYFSDRKPTLYLYLTEMQQGGEIKISSLEEKYNAFLDDCIAGQNPGSWK